MLERRTAEFLEGGCSLVVGVVGADATPHATRGWGLTVVSDEPPTARLLIPADDSVVNGHLGAGGRIAVTAADVRTLRSVQLKGRALRVEPSTDDDVRRAARYSDAFFADVHATDGTDPARLARLLPPGYAACVLTIEELYDQTPGPAAGAPLRSGAT